MRCRIEFDGQRVDVVKDPLHDGARDRQRSDGQHGRGTLSTVLAAGGSSDVHDDSRPAPRSPEKGSLDAKRLDASGWHGLRAV
jgi:hypothetical protein